MPRNSNNPGLFVTYRDGNLVVPTTTATTGNMTIIDFALWGPTNQPYTFSTIDAGQAIFGKTSGAYGDFNRITGYNGNAAMKAAAEALQSGNRNITVVRPNFGGTQAKTTIFSKLNDSFGVRVITAGSGSANAKLSLTGDADHTDLLTKLKVGQACWKNAASSVIYKIAGIDSTAGAEAVYLETLGADETLAVDTTVQATKVLGTSTASITLTAGSSYVGEDGNNLDVEVLAADASETPVISFANDKLTITLGTVGANNTATLVKNAINASPAAENKVIASLETGNGAGTVIAAVAASFSGGTGPTYPWTFAIGISLNGAYVGAAGNTIKYKMEASGDNLLFKVKVPKEFGGYSQTYSSLYNGTLGSLAANINKAFANILTVSLDYATGTETFGLTDESDFYGELTNDADTAVVLTSVYDVVNPTNDGWFRIGETPIGTGVDSNLVGTSIAGSDALDTAFGLKNPSLGNISSDLKHQWYAEALGNVNNVDDAEKTLPLLIGQPIGAIVIDGLNIDDMVDKVSGEIRHMNSAGVPGGATPIAYKNALQYLLDFCHLQNNEGFATELVMGCSPLRSTTLSAINARAAFLRNLEFMEGTLANKDSESELVDAGRYLSVVAGPQVIVNNREVGSYNASGAIQYAALLTTTPVSNPPSQKQVNGVLGTAFSFSKTTMSNLSGGQGNTRTGGAFVVFDNYGGATIVNLGVTAAARTSDYAKKHNIRVVQAAGAAVRSAVRPFLGNAFGVEQYNAMYTSIQSALDVLVDAGVIYGGKGVGYDFSITQTDADAILSVANVALAIRPNFELDWVNVDVKLKV